MAGEGSDYARGAFEVRHSERGDISVQGTDVTLILRAIKEEGMIACGGPCPQEEKPLTGETKGRGIMNLGTHGGPRANGRTTTRTDLNCRRQRLPGERVPL